MRIRDNRVRKGKGGNEYFQQFMTRVRDNGVRESNEYFQQFMTRIRDNEVRRVKVYSSKDEQEFKFH